MALLNAIVNKIKFFIIAVIDTIKYICCSRKERRKLSTDFIPLSSVGVVPNDNSLTINYNNGSWNQEAYKTPNESGNLKNVHEYINQYRQQKLSQIQNAPVEEVQTDFFQDMEPKIVKQKKILMKQAEEREIQQINSRLSFSAVSTGQTPNVLSSWEEMENTGSWDVEENNTDEILKEKRRLERERKLAEKAKKKIEKDKNRIASKIT